MSNDEFTIQFRGVRGGHPMPGPQTVKYGGNTTCFEVRVGGNMVIVDAGTGVISLGREMIERHHASKEPILATLLLTHLHHDHTQGLPFFSPIHDQHATIYIFGAKPSDTTTLDQELWQALQPPLFPIGLEELYSQRHVQHIRGGDKIILQGAGASPQLITVHHPPFETSPEAVTIRVLHGYNHPRVGILIFRIEYKGRSAVIATDTEGFVGGDRKLINFAQGADLLIHDAEYDEHEYGNQRIIRQGWGHSTWRMAVEVAQAAGIKQLGLFHHSTTHDDAFLDAMERKAQAVFPNTFMAREGLAVSVL